MLELTGERIIPSLMKPTNGMLLEHIARYYFATPYVKGRVLDIACGSGYGTQMIAKACKADMDEIIGVDIDEATIQYAAANYYHPMSTFVVDDALDPTLPNRLGEFDTILSFETIEHLTDDQAFVKNLYAMLRPGGTLVASTPFGQGRGIPTPRSPFHVHQLTEEEFTSLFVDYSEVLMYYQRGVTFELEPRDVRYPFGIAVCKK